MFLEDYPAVPTWTKQRPDRADHSCVQRQETLVSIKLTDPHSMSPIWLLSKWAVTADSPDEFGEM